MFDESYVPPSPPDGLGVVGQDLWISIVGTEDDPKYELRPDELRILEDACRASDVVARLEAYLAEPDTPLMVASANRSTVLNPAIQEVRMQRQFVAQSLRSLRLPDPDADDASGRPMTTSELARKAANARWARRGG